MVADHFVDDEAQEFLGKVWIELRIARQLTKPVDLSFFTCGIGGRKRRFCFILADRLRNLKPLSEHENQGSIDIVDAVAVAGKCVVLAHFVYVPRLKVQNKRKCAICTCLGAPQLSEHMTMSATIHQIGGHRAPSLDPMLKLVAAGMNKVNAVILDRMQSEIPLIPELAGHLIAGGGKRMRPMLTLACARLLDYPGERHHKLAAAVEFIHTATLLHDDVVDGSDMRRGKTAANLIFGNPAAVLVGDFLFSRSFELMVEDGSLKVLKILSNASAVIAEGEVNQLTAQRQISTSEEKYLEIIGSKTAALFAAACRIASVVAESGEAQEMALDAYGRNLGIAFQLVDDAIDYVSDGATMGKDSGDDFRDGKVTLPVILAHCRGTPEEQKFWRDAMLGNRISADDLAHATTLLRKHGAIDDTIDRARHYGQRAIDAIAHFPAGEAKAALSEAVEFAIARAY